MANNSLQKFNQLSRGDREYLSSSFFLSVINRLESQYNIELAMIFIELIIGDLLLKDLGNRFPNLDANSIGIISNELAKLINNFKNRENKSILKPVNSVISFSPDDDEEIKQIISSINMSPKVHDYNSLAEMIITESGYNTTGDEVILGRLKNIIIASLRDVRDEMETIEALTKSRKIGGLEMTSDQAKKIISLVKEKISQGLLSLVDQKSEEKSTLSFPVRKPFVKEKTTLEAIKNNSVLKEPIVELKKVEENKIEKPSLALMPQIEEEDGLPVIKYPQGDDLMVKPKIVGFNAEKKVQSVNRDLGSKVFPAMPSVPPVPVKLVEKKPVPERPVVTPQPQPMLKSTPPPKNIRFGKPSVDGVKVGPMLVGPVEELGTMTLINFRRLGETPHRVTAKIKEKIDLLEKDSYAKKLQGIEAWHKSEVNRFYRLLGQESMRQERSIDDIINERIKDNKPTLSIEEFNSVMELNKELRY